MKSTTVAVDLAKSVFQLAIADSTWRVTEQHRLTRTQRVGWATKPNVEIGKGQNILRAIDVGLCSPTYGPVSQQSGVLRVSQVVQGILATRGSTFRVE
jgi:hypothetical protein